jgi:hypothetical protein
LELQAVSRAQPQKSNRVFFLEFGYWIRVSSVGQKLFDATGTGALHRLPEVE